MLRRGIAGALFLVACRAANDDALSEVPANAAPVALHAQVRTEPLDSGAKITSAAIYRREAGPHWIVATTTRDAIVVFDATTGRLIRSIGVTGPRIGELDHPVGVTILGDSIALVVERGNRRVQGFHLPDFTSVGTFGDQLLAQPIAIAGYPVSNAYGVVIADNNGESGRVLQFRLTVGNGELVAIHWRTFGSADTLGILASIAADGARDVLMIDAAGGTAPGVKIFDLSGRNSHTMLGEPASVARRSALLDCGGGAAYWIAASGPDSSPTFHVFERGARRRVGVVSDSSHALASVFGVIRGGSPAIWGLRADSTLASFDWGAAATAMGILRDCYP